MRDFQQALFDHRRVPQILRNSHYGFLEYMYTWVSMDKL
jgi:hypothetical protein